LTEAATASRHPWLRRPQTRRIDLPPPDRSRHWTPPRRLADRRPPRRNGPPRNRDLRDAERPGPSGQSEPVRWSGAGPRGGRGRNPLGRREPWGGASGIGLRAAGAAAAPFGASASTRWASTSAAGPALISSVELVITKIR